MVSKEDESENIFADNLQILVWKITALKPAFRLEANEQLKQQYVHKLKDSYYTPIAHNSSKCLDMESFTQFHGWLAMTFIGHNRLGKTTNHRTAVDVSLAANNAISRGGTITVQKFPATIK